MTWQQWVLIGLIVVLIVAYPLLTRARNKKENERLIEQTNSLKRGDKILTSSGVYGTILEVRQEENGAKTVVFETGNDKYKSYMTIDAYAVYAVLNDKPEVKEEIKIKEPKVEAKAETKVEEKQVEEKPAEEAKTEKKKAKKSTANKPTKKETK